MKKFETGLEGASFIESPIVSACPVSGRPVGLEVCRAGRAGEPCNYFIDLEQMPRGANKEDKVIVLCGAPRALPVISGFFPEAKNK